MTAEKIIYVAKNRKTSLVLGGLFFAAFSFLFLVYSQKNFKASSDVLITQNQTGYTDYYTLSKSADYLSSVITESIYSEKFLDEVIATKMMNPDFLPQDKITRLKFWRNTIRTTKNASVGIIHLEVFANTQKQSMDISSAALSILTEKSSLFLGQGQSVDVKILSGPIWEKNPSLNSLILVTVGGFFIGILLIFIWLYYAEEIAASQMYSSNNNSEKDDYQKSLEYLEKQ